jgi:hypothetical protein
MNRRFLTRILFVAFIVVGISALLLWSPWITSGYAEAAVVRSFEAQWENVVDGCGFNCQGCGVMESERVPFGYRVVIVYACGLLPADSPEFYRQSEAFVSLFSTVHELPMPE